MDSVLMNDPMRFTEKERKNKKRPASWIFYQGLLVFLVALGLQVYAQQQGMDEVIKDSAKFGHTIRQRAGAQRTDGMDTVISYQLRKLRGYSSEVSGISGWLKRGVDTIGLWEKLQQVQSSIHIARQGVFDSVKTLNNVRNLKSTLILIQNINDQLQKAQEKSEQISQRIYEAQQKLISLRSDTLMRIVPKDSLLANEYYSRVREVMEKSLPTYRELQRLALNIGIYQNKIAELQLGTENDIIELKYRLELFGGRLFRQELPIAFGMDERAKVGLKEAIQTGLQKAFYAFRVYFGATWDVHAGIILMFLTFLLAGFLGIRTLKKRPLDNQTSIVKHWLKYPLLASLFIALGFGQFFYENAPAGYIQFLWIVMVLIGTVIFRQNFSSRSMVIWASGLVLFLVVCLDNLFVQVTPGDRLIMYLIGLTGIFLVLAYLKIHYTKRESELPMLQALLILFLIQQAISILSNFAGRYTLAKIMFTGGYFNLINGIILWWMVNLLTEFVYLFIESIRHKESLTPYLNFSKINEGTRPLLNALMIILWLVIFAKNLNLYDLVVDGIGGYLAIERTIGNFSFSLGSILIFFVVLYASSLAANVISYVFGPGQQNVLSGSKSRFGGTILIFRLLILTLGFLLAVAAAGIPLDKITIIIGALGVGIGFGLQNIVSNLISGVIIAFEKPINIGDQIEVGGKVGKVMEIGIRSSKLATFDGAEVIIPNGDLLNQHLVNWTLSSNNRRVEILVGVKYGTDLKRVQGLLEEILKEKGDILPIPAPAVLVNQFGPSSIEFRVLFWTGSGDWIELKSLIIQEIDQAFKANGIEIPFPQQDIYIKEIKGFEKDYPAAP